MTTNDNTPAKTPPDWAVADRPRPIEELLQASSAEVCFTFVIEAVRRIDPAEVPSVDVLIEALATAKIVDDHSLYFRRGIDAVLLHEELRPALILGLAIRGMPGAAGEVAQAFAALAVGLSRWLRDSAKGATSPDEKAVVRRVEQRARIARQLSTGWGAIAAGVGSDYAEAGATTHAMALGAEIDAATAARLVLPEPTSREEEAILNDGWQRRIEALYGHLGVGYIAAGRGWYGLIEDALEAIDASLRPEDREGFAISDIKEKYGTLRIYCDNAPDAVEAIIEIAERRSATTCDRCGDHGRVGGRGWLACRCGRHDMN